MKSLQKKLVCLQTPMKMERYHITLKNNNYLNMKLALKITVLLFLTQFSFSQEKTCEYEIDILTDTSSTRVLKDKIIRSDNILDSNVYYEECKLLCPLECNQTLFKTSLSFNQLNGNQYKENIFNNE